MDVAVRNAGGFRVSQKVGNFLVRDPALPADHPPQRALLPRRSLDPVVAQLRLCVANMSHHGSGFVLRDLKENKISNA